MGTHITTSKTPNLDAVLDEIRELRVIHPIKIETLENTISKQKAESRKQKSNDFPVRYQHTKHLNRLTIALN